ncbi:MAG: hypothetical protein RM338_26285 [Nostoc sp. DedQUE12a]|nr:hypothetical protein [Nostoc sp. DedQUE12a]
MVVSEGRAGGDARDKNETCEPPSFVAEYLSFVAEYLSLVNAHSDRSPNQLRRSHSTMRYCIIT